MGRPLKKVYFGNTATAGNQMQFKAYVNGAAVDSYVVSQRGTRKYKFQNGANTATCYLVNKAVGSLGAGEASMVVTPYSGTGSVGYASKITEKRVYVYSSTTKGSITAITISNAGSGYTDGTYSLSGLAGGTAGTGAAFTVVVSGNAVTSVTLVNGGYNFIPTETIALTGLPAGANAQVTVSTVYAPPASYIWKASASAAGEATVIMA